MLSHCGLDVDQQIAANVGEHVDVIVGGHSHTFLYSGEDPPGPDTPRGEYPVLVTQPGGHTIPIVQASAYTKYLGEFILYFDGEGKVTRHTGNPRFLGPHIVPDPKIVEEMIPWKEQIDKEGLVVIGSTLTRLDKGPCSNRECNIANLVTQSYLHKVDFYFLNLVILLFC